MYGNKARYYDCNNFDISPLNIGNDPRTTLMIRNIPNKYTIQDLSNEIDQNFENSYDFLYLPCDIKVLYFLFQNNCNVGYGFINFVSTEILFEFYKRFHSKKWLKFRSDKVLIKLNIDLRVDLRETARTVKSNRAFPEFKSVEPQRQALPTDN